MEHGETPRTACNERKYYIGGSKGTQNSEGRKIASKTGRLGFPFKEMPSQTVSETRPISEEHGHVESP